MKKAICLSVAVPYADRCGGKQYVLFSSKTSFTEKIFHFNRDGTLPPRKDADLRPDLRRLRDRDLVRSERPVPVPGVSELTGFRRRDGKRGRTAD